MFKMIFEDLTQTYKLSFSYNGNPVEFKGSDFSEIFTKTLDWLDSNSYDFKGKVHEPFERKIFTATELAKLISTSGYTQSRFYNINNSGKFIQKSKVNIYRRVQNLILMLVNFGIKEDTIKTEGFDSDSKVKKFTAFKKESDSMSFVEAAEEVLMQNGNRPMSSREIWDDVAKKGLIQSKGKTPHLSMNSIITAHSINFESMVKKTDRKPRKESEVEKSIFEITQQDPYKFKLAHYGAETKEEDKPVVNFTEFKQPESKKHTERKINPFGGAKDSSALCILGKSGSGKSTTTTNLLANASRLEGSHITDLIIPTATTTSLLAQYSPSKGEYIPSRLGRLIMRAQNDPSRCYTAIMDECHKASTIERINDELLQAISTRRNRGERFLSLDDDVAQLYKPSKPDAKYKYKYRKEENTEPEVGLDENENGNLLLPPNFGFIFLSSNAKVITSNPDFFNRVDIAIFPTKPIEEREKFWKSITDFDKLPHGIITDADKAYAIIKKESEPGGSLYIAK